jgi:hypothetical protein
MRLRKYFVIVLLISTSFVSAMADEEVKLFPIVKGGKWGYMDEKGKVVIEPQYDGAGDFSEGLAWVGRGLLRGYINPKGEMVIKPKYGWAADFHSGIAAVYGHADGQPIGARASDIWGDDLQMYKPQATCLYIDKTGKVIGSECSPMDFSEGKACYRGICIGTDGKRIQHDAEDIRPFSDGLAAARKGDRWGYLDHSMKWVIEPAFHLAEEFSNGLAAVAMAERPPSRWAGRELMDWLKNGKLKWGYIDSTGKLVIPYQFAAGGAYSEELIPVQLETGGKWGYVDKSGKVVIEPKFDYAWRFSEGRGRVLVGEKFGYVDKTGKLVIEPKFDTAWEFSKGLARVGIGNKEGYINHDGKYIWEPTE